MAAGFSLRFLKNRRLKSAATNKKVLKYLPQSSWATRTDRVNRYGKKPGIVKLTNRKIMALGCKR